MRQPTEVTAARVRAEAQLVGLVMERVRDQLAIGTPRDRTCRPAAVPSRRTSTDPYTAADGLLASLLADAP